MKKRVDGQLPIPATWALIVTQPRPLCRTFLSDPRTEMGSWKLQILRRVLPLHLARALLFPLDVLLDALQRSHAF